MGRKRIIVGQSEWGVEDDLVKDTIDRIKEALETNSLAELQLLNAAGRPVTVYLNAQAVQTVVIDLDLDPRPSEISVSTTV